MRKSARRPAVKTPQPSVPIIPTSSGKPPVKRPCWYCGHREAVDFGQLYHPTVQAVFCSTVCTLKACLEFVAATQLTFCEVHRDWTDRSGDCAHCIAEHGPFPHGRKLPRPPVSNIKKEVPHA